MTTPNYMAQLGATLVDRGFPILPTQPRSKKPGMYRQGAWHDYPKWSRHCERATTENEVDIWGDWPESGIGIAAGQVVGIDLDVLDARVCAQIEGLAKRLLGDTPAVRIGRAPKRLLVYRAVQPFAGFKYPPIEVLGQGQQFIAYGIHPDTGLAYDWPVESLADLALDDLPAITEAQAREFAREAYGLVPPELRPKTLGVGRQAVGSVKAGECTHLPEQRGTFAAVEDALTCIVNADLDYDSWVRIGMAIKGALGDAGWPLFEAWSASSQKFEAKTTAKSWRSFAPQRIGAGTLYKLALDNGWMPAADLQLNGEVVSEGVHPAQGLIDGLRENLLGELLEAAEPRCLSASTAHAAAGRLGCRRRRAGRDDAAHDHHRQAAAAGIGTRCQPVCRRGADGAQVLHREQHPLEPVRRRHCREWCRQEPQPGGDQ